MRFYETIKNFLLDKEEYLIFFNNHVHIYGIENIITLNESLIVVNTKKKNINLKGTKMKILKMTKEELLIEGLFESVTFND